MQGHLPHIYSKAHSVHWSCGSNNNMVPIHIKIKWKSAENSAPGCNSLFDISVSSFTMTHIEKWTVWQTYSGISFFFFHFLFKSVIYILAEIPTSFFSSEVSHLHTRCISSLVSARLKDWHTGPTFELQLKVNNCRVWLNILFMHGGGGGICLIVSAATLSGLHLWLNTAALTSLLVC